MTNPAETTCPDAKAERARLLAFAFARSDLLLELDTTGTITYALGAAESLVHVPATQLMGRRLADLMTTGSATAVGEMTSSNQSGKRLAAKSVYLSHGEKPIGAMLAAFPLPNAAGHSFVTLTRLHGDPDDRAAGAKPLTDPPGIARDTGTGLLDAQSFEKIATQKLKDAKQRGDETLQMTMVDVEGLDQMKERLTEPAAEAFMRDFGALLRQKSADGDSATMVAPNKFGMLHDGSVDTDALKSQLSELAKAADPDGVGVTLATADMSLDNSGMTDADANRALLYALNKFAQEPASSLAGNSLATGLQAMVADTKARIASFRDTLASRGFELYFQPIVGLDDLSVHHQEALTRMPDGGSPFAMVTFAEEAGFITDFDLAVVRRAAALLEANQDALGIAVNISGRSFESSLFVSDLEEVLKRYVRNRKQLLIEITESHRVQNFTQVANVLARLAELGHSICIDDFGSGAAAFQYLRAFKVNVVKIDGLFIRDVDKNSQDQAFVRAMQRMCGDMGIEMIAEMIEDKPQAELLKSYDVQFGQGYLFGKARPQLYREGATPSATTAAHISANNNKGLLNGLLRV